MADSGRRYAISNGSLSLKRDDPGILPNPGSIGGITHGNVFAFTANYRLELRGRTGGIYFIGGPGWIYLTASLSRAIPQGTPVPCSPIYLWWGYNCADGPVITNSTSVHSSAGAPGLNGGIGFTVRTGEAPYRAYVESRYYFAPTGSVSTKLLTLTVGIRY